MILKGMVQLLISNDSTCQFYYKVNTCFRPNKKSGRGDDIDDIILYVSNPHQHYITYFHADFRFGIPLHYIANATCYFANLHTSVIIWNSAILSIIGIVRNYK